MLSSSVRLFKTRDKKRDKFTNRKYTFPEQHYLIADPSGVSIAISGGGTRSCTAACGYIGMLTKMNLMKKVQYISTVSGGGWFAAPYTFTEIGLGSYKPPEELTMSCLMTDNFDDDTFFGKVCVKLPLFEKLLEGKHVCERHDIWNYGVSKCILEPFGLHDKVPVMTQRRADQMNKESSDALLIENGNVEDRFICPLEKRPFWIAGSAVLCDKGPIPFASTPMYSGIPKKVKVGENIVGNFFIETMAIGMSKPDIRVNDFVYHTNVDVTGERYFTIGDMIGTSSAAFSFYSEKLSDEIGQVLGTISYGLNDIDPQYNFWCLDQYNSQYDHCEVKLVDGYRANNTGILPLLARGCKKILMFINNLHIDTDYCNTDLFELFGTCTLRCDYPDLTDSVKVFNEDDWSKMEEQFESRKMDGGPVYCRVTLPVLENKHNCIKGGYDVELLIYLLYPSRNFVDKLSSDIIDEMREECKFERFPNFKTIFQNQNSMGEYTPEQFNLLFYYTQWCLKETEDIVTDFFK